MRVHLTMVADNRRYHVALTDPLPAGLEIINPALAVSGSTPQDPNSPDYRYGWWWWGTWYEHQNLREDGVWHIKAGARVRVHLTMVADNRRYHVALTDPLPAGLEIINPALAVSGSTPQDPNSPDYRYGWWWWGTWYEHQNLRDERAEAFTSLLWDGVYQYTYTARATTPGRFIVPPAKAEEMYSLEVFGRSGSNVVVIQ